MKRKFYVALTYSAYIEAEDEDQAVDYFYYDLENEKGTINADMEVLDQDVLIE